MKRAFGGTGRGSCASLHANENCVEIREQIMKKLTVVLFDDIILGSAIL